MNMKLLAVGILCALSSACVSTGMGLQAAYGAAAVNGQPVPRYTPPLYTAPKYGGELYDVTVTRIADDEYQDQVSRRVIYTRFCYTYVYGASAVLRLNGSSDSTLTFNDARQICDVVGLK